MGCGGWELLPLGGPRTVLTTARILGFTSYQACPLLILGTSRIWEKLLSKNIVWRTLSSILRLYRKFVSRDLCWSAGPGRVVPL